MNHGARDPGPEHRSSCEGTDETNGSISQGNAVLDNSPSHHAMSLATGAGPKIQASANQGRLDVSGFETSYVGATHWAAILEDVSCIWCQN